MNPTFRPALVAGLLSLVLCAGLTLAAGPAMAQDPVGVDAADLIGPPQGQPLEGEALEELTEDIAGTMRCPVCQGLSVADSTTPTAMAMKAEVRQLLAAGYLESQVLDYFEKSYGEFIRLAPKAEGFNLMVWIAPVAVLLFGLGMIGMRVRRKRPGGAATENGAADPEVDDPDFDLEAYLERVRREVAS